MYRRFLTAYFTGDDETAHALVCEKGHLIASWRGSGPSEEFLASIVEYLRSAEVLRDETVDQLEDRVALYYSEAFPTPLPAIKDGRGWKIDVHGIQEPHQTRTKERQRQFVSTFKNPFTGDTIEGLNLGALAEPFDKRNINHRGIYLRHNAAQMRNSCFRGTPSVSRGTEWPIGKLGPLPLIACIDFSEVRTASPTYHNWLPISGRLNIFYDGAEWGPVKANGEHFRLIYAEEPTEPLTPPDSVDTQNSVSISLDVDRSHTWGPTNAPRHKLGGYPDWIQQKDPRPRLFLETGDYLRYSDVVSEIVSAGVPPDAFKSREKGVEIAKKLDESGARLEPFQSGVADWKLLMQIDSDPNAKLSWGDAGRLYLFMTTSSMAARQFDDAWLVLQCY